MNNDSLGKGSCWAAPIAIIGAPMDLGAGRRGVDMGPSAVRVANLGQRLRGLNRQIVDRGNVPVELPETLATAGSGAKYVRQILETCRRLADEVEAALEGGQIPLVLGGDHSIAMGTVTGLSSFLKKRGKSCGLIWVDAHADMNTPATSPSGNVHGMPLACLLGEGPDALVNLGGSSPKLSPRNVVLVGLRDVDSLERNQVRAMGVHAFTMREIDERGMRAIMSDAIAAASDGTDGFHLSLDMDAIDPREAPGVGTPVPGGLTYREAHLAMELISDTGLMTSMEVVEVNPVLDEQNRTALLAVELTLSALGKRIL